MNCAGAPMFYTAGVLNSFLPGGWEIHQSKKLPGGFAGRGDGQAWN